MTPKEKAHKLHMKYYFMLPNNGSHTGLVSIPVRWREGIECAIAAVDAIIDFMQMDDEYHEDTHFANSKWASYWTKVKEELNRKLEDVKMNKTSKIFESPDGGKTVYERPFGGSISERKLVERKPVGTFKVKMYNPNNLEEVNEVDTGVDSAVVEIVRDAFNTSDTFVLTPPMLEHDAVDVLFGVLMKTSEGLVRKYRIKIEKVTYE